MDKTSALGFRIPDEMKAALVAAAKKDDRSVSSLVTRILREWLIRNRYLSDDLD
jgi:predicted HicB family RNase H-like nuclease